MQAAEAAQLAQRCAPQFAQAGLPATDGEPKVSSVRSVARLWGGMGAVYEITLALSPEPIVIIAKRVSLPSRCTSIGDERKRVSYHCEAAFYANGHAEALLREGCAVPRPLLVEDRGSAGLTICMTRLVGRSPSMDEAATRAAMVFLARMHARHWGAARADEAVGAGLQPQGTYWYLDTRPDEHEAMPRRGWEGRLRLAARAIDARLKADPMQTIVHGDAKDANMLLLAGGEAAFYDFQYCGKAPPTKDLAYALTCASDVPALEARMLSCYRDELCARLRSDAHRPPAAPPPTLAQLEASLELAYCDLGRWMSGWGWWGNDLRDKIEPVLDRLDGGKPLKSEAAYEEAVRREFPI